MYGKHFASTYTGSMVGAGLNVFAVWGYVIANTVKGRVELNPKMLAMLLGGPQPEIEKAIEYLQRPDPDSRSKDHEGRRLIREGQYQYFVPTFDTYRKILNEDERRDYNRLKQQEHRARKAAVNMSKRESLTNKHCQHIQSTEAEAEANTEHPPTPSKGESGCNELSDTKPTPVTIPEDLHQKAFTAFGSEPMALADWVRMHPIAEIAAAIVASQGKTWRYAEKILQRRAAAGYPGERHYAAPEGDRLE